nr:unnamed protein product [uncultured bacterium]
MATRFCDFNLNGDQLQNLTGERNSNQALAVVLPSPEHKTLAHYFAEINRAQAQLASLNAEESDLEFFNFGPEDFDENPSQFEAFYMALSDWRNNRAQTSPMSAPQAPQGGQEVVQTKEQAEPDSHSSGTPTV